MKDQITIQADHPTIPHVTHLRIQCFNTFLLLRWGYFYSGRFCCAKDEELPFSQHPELSVLYDGQAWNVGEVFDLVAGSVSQFGSQSPTTANTTH